MEEEREPGSGLGDTRSLVNELPPSDLGRKDYWDSDYASQIALYTEDGIEPEGWFDENVKKRVIRYLNTLVSNGIVSKCTAIGDLGCGNGEIIDALIEDDWTNVTGYDYSENAIKLCKLIFATKDIRVTLKVVDLLNEDTFDAKFVICHDKGTYDAISLIPTTSQSESRRKYLQNVDKLLEEEGYFVITSCNWTVQELEDQFREWFDLLTVIPTPQISFGGSSGNTICMAVFNKKKKT